MANHLLKVVVFLSFVFLSKGNGVFDDILDNISACKLNCISTYSLQSKEQDGRATCCQRGCRLFSIMEFVGDNLDFNVTRVMCYNACREAYVQSEEYVACSFGCDEQVPIAVQRRKQLADAAPVHILAPIMRMHNMCQTMMDHVWHRVSYQWSVYMQSDDNGNMVIIQSEPSVYLEYGAGDELLDDFFDEGKDAKTPFHIESILQKSDNSATPNMKHTQLGAMGEQMQELNLAVDTPDSQASDWLSCISTKTGLPRLILTAVVVLCSFVMIWLCLSAVHTAPEQHVYSGEKLSINGDMENIPDVELAKLLAFDQLGVHDRLEARPLPTKIRVHRL